MNTIRDHLPWLIPLLVSILAVGFQIYGLIHRVDALEESSRTRGESAIIQLQKVDNRVSRLEEFCCGEVEGYKHFIKREYDGMDSNTGN
jgi:hypothetical protein